MSGDPEQGYFSDGISEDIVTALSKLRWFFVIARNSSFFYKGKAVHLTQIAEELGVGYVVDGSVRKDGGCVRITAQLNDAATGRQLRAERYDRSLADVFAVQDEITQAVVAHMDWADVATAAPVAERAALAAIRADSEDPWAHRALGCAYLFTRGFSEALAAFEAALRLNPSFSLARGYYGLALSYSGRWEEAMRLARETIRRRGDLVAAQRVPTSAAGMAGQHDAAEAALRELRRMQPDVSLARIAGRTPIKPDAQREHYLDGFRRAGLD